MIARCTWPHAMPGCEAHRLDLKGDHAPLASEDARMKKSTERIHTSHAGSLPRPDDLIELNRARLAEGFGDEAAFQERLRAAVMDVLISLISKQCWP